MRTFIFFLSFRFTAMTTRQKSTFVYKTKKEEISGDPSYVLKFKEQQYNFRIKWVIIFTTLTTLAAAIKFYFFAK